MHAYSVTYVSVHVSQSYTSLIGSVAKATNALEDGFVPLLEDCHTILSTSLANKEEIQLVCSD